MRRPLPLRPGDPIAVVAPASAPRDLDRYEEGLAQLRALYDVRTAWAPGQERGYLSAPDAVRAAALNDAVADPALRALICVRGGYGSLRLLPDLDWAPARSRPPLLIGYSDITALHLAYFARTGWPGLSGPVVTEWPKLDEGMLGSFRALVEGDSPSFHHDELRAMQGGTATGPLLGGNLSVLSRLVGTPYAPNWNGAILVLEDIAEAPYRIDRMLSHLQHAGVLEAVGGVVLGAFGDATEEAESPTLSLETVFADYFEHRSYPVVAGLPYGHQLPRVSLPLGLPARLAVSGGAAEVSVSTPLVSS